MNDAEKASLLEVVRIADLATMIGEEGNMKGKLEKNIEIAKKLLRKGRGVHFAEEATGGHQYG